MSHSSRSGGPDEQMTEAQVLILIAALIFAGLVIVGLAFFGS